MVLNPVNRFLPLIAMMERSTIAQNVPALPLALLASRDSKDFQLLGSAATNLFLKIS